MPVNYCDNCYQPYGCCLCYFDEFCTAVAVDPDNDDSDDDDSDLDFDDSDIPRVVDPSKEPTDVVPQGDPPGGSD